MVFGSYQFGYNLMTNVFLGRDSSRCPTLMSTISSSCKDQIDPPSVRGLSVTFDGIEDHKALTKQQGNLLKSQPEA